MTDGSNNTGPEAAEAFTSSTQINGVSNGLGMAADQRIDMTSISRLTPHPRNARVHSRKQVGQITKSIQRFGFNNPVLIDERGQIIAGHGRVEAAKLLGLTEIPTLRLSHMSEAEVRAYIIADNKLAEETGWDREILATELECLVDLNFDLEVVGFNPGEVAVILATDNAECEAARRNSSLLIHRHCCKSTAITPPPAPTSTLRWRVR